MSLNFTRKFMKTLRLSLGLNEHQISIYLDMPLSQYSEFEENPIAFSGKTVAVYLEFLQSIPDVSNIDQVFLEFARFDLMTDTGSIDIFKRYPLRLVPKPETLAVC